MPKSVWAQEEATVVEEENDKCLLPIVWAARRLERKLRSLEKLNQHVDTLESEGFLLIYTDDSSERFPAVGWVGGCGVYSGVGLKCPILCLST